MKHVFIINPAAGKRDRAAELMAAAKRLKERHGLDVETVLTRRPGHAAETARTAAQRGGPVRIYACGGDGTLSEVAGGMAGFPNAAMTCVPAGTGNDFLKNFGDKAALFADPENFWDGPQFPLDAIDCGGKLALTVACSGFDAQVAEDVHRYGDLPLLKGQGSYIASLAVNFLIRGLSHRWTVTADGETFAGDYALAAVCNGRYYGGGFIPTLAARMDDGILDTILVKKVSRLTFLRLVGKYAKGQYYLLPDYARRVAARELTIESPEADIVTCLDGETSHSRKVTIRLSDKKVNFFGPAGADPNATWAPLPENLSDARL